MPSATSSTVEPDRTFVTVSKGDNVTLAVNVADASAGILQTGYLQWRFNKVLQPQFLDHTHAVLSNVSEENSGVYECHLKNSRGSGTHAIMYLNVSKCPSGMWGESCDQSCDQCLNGGSCDPDSGLCVCPPGFMGTICEQVLGRNRYGKNGTLSCDSSGDNHAAGCRGKLFCLPDPFGCSCAAGYMGPDCVTECKPGTYGANCLQECRCYPQNECRKDTGECLEGNQCEGHWVGVNCQELSSAIEDQTQTTDELSASTMKSTSQTFQPSAPVSMRSPATDGVLIPLSDLPHSPTPLQPHEATPTGQSSYRIESFNFTKVNDGQPTLLLCTVSGDPLPPEESISVERTSSGSWMGEVVSLGSHGNDTLTSVAYAFQVMVRSDNGSQGFQCVIKTPDGDIVSAEVLVSVYELPALALSPRAPSNNVTSDSITLNWLAWHSSTDEGEGPVIGYKVYYRVAGHGSEFMSVSMSPITGLTTTVMNLTLDTEYEFAVAAVRQGEGGVGPLSRSLTVRTKCVAPSAVPNLTVTDRGLNNLTVVVTLPGEDFWGCSELTTIYVWYRQDGGGWRTLHQSPSEEIFVITGLHACSQYDVAAAFANRDGTSRCSEIIQTSTAAQKPEQVGALQETSASMTQLEFSWTTAESSCAADYFIIRYTLQSKKACSTPETNPIQQERNTTVLTYTLTDLEAYSWYSISVVAVNSAGESSEVATSADTSEGRPPTVTNIKIDPSITSPTSIGFTWDSLSCQNVGGRFWYYYARIYKKGEKKRAIALPESRKKRFYNCSDSSVVFDNLEACTKYELDISAVNHGYSGDVVTAPGNTRVTYSQTMAVHNNEPRRLTVTWNVPYQCRVQGYQLTYQLAQREACPQEAVNDSQLLGVNSNTSRVILTGLENYAVYDISIATVIDGTLSVPEILNGTTLPGKPGMPENLVLSELEDEKRITAGLNVQWNAPTTPPCLPAAYNISYELLFRDQCSTEGAGEISEGGVVGGAVEGAEGRSGPFAFNLTGLLPNSNYRIYVAGSTSAGPGSPAKTLARTGFAAPSGPPTQVEAITIKKRSLTFSWEEPVCGKRNGPITHYDYILYDWTGAMVASGSQPSGSTEKKFSNLTPYSYYSVSLRARNDDLAKEYGPNSTARTSEAKPARPRNVSVPHSSPNYLVVQWRSPYPPEGRIINFYIFYWETRDSNSTVHNVSIPCYQEDCPIHNASPCRLLDCQNPDVMHTHSVMGLKPDTNYSIQVRAESIIDVGPAAPRTPIVQLTAEGKPSAPRNVSISNIGESSMTVSWTVPEYPNGRISQYKILIRVKRKPLEPSFVPSTSDTEVIPVEGDVWEHILRDLEAAVCYEVGVIAATSKGGDGDRSLFVEACTKPPSDLPMPSPPVIQISPSSSKPIIMINAVESKYITHVLVSVTRINPTPSRRRRENELNAYHANPNSYIGAKFSRDEFPVNFTLGDNQTYGGYYNAPLVEGASYEIRTGVVSDTEYSKSVVFGDPTKFNAPIISKPEKPKSGVGVVVAGIMVSLVLIVVVGVAVLYIRRRRMEKSNPTRSVFYAGKPSASRSSYNNEVPLRHVSTLGRDTRSVDGLSDASVHQEDPAIYANFEESSSAHQPIPLNDLIDFVARKKASPMSGFRQEYDTIPSSQLHPWDVAEKPENKRKNRYKNIIAYDHSRVKLTPFETDPHSDYINASYIDGYKCPQMYIATQGPNVETVKDFWRMIWQYDCRKIVMLTNLVEGGKKKCEKYWPQRKMLYGNITVDQWKEETNVHYTVRNFTLRKEHESREVIQFHYTSWPDMGVPNFTTPLMNFIQTTKLYETEQRGPVVVHCSAGVGRTGTFITLDSMLSQAEAENTIDVYNFVCRMRHQRIKMVQVSEQYQFIFEALLETFTCGDTSISQDVFPQRYASLLTPSPDTGSTILQEQFQRLDIFTIKPSKQEQRAARDSENTNKNRYVGKVPTDKSRPYLITEVENTTNYINASFLPGYTKKDAFLGTQTPLPNTVIDFWRLVFDYKVSTIVMLNGHPSEDASMARYWPDGIKGDLAVGPFTVKLTNEENSGEITCRTLELTSSTTKSRVQTVYQLQLNTWPMTAEITSSPESIIELQRQAMAFTSSTGKDSPVLVHCKDGEGATGTFVALCGVLERLQEEKLVDVFQACKKLRAIRKHAVATQDQYEFIYNIVRLHLDSYDIYMNYR
ncbi:receptor-type tyrosine-protein phosphatase S-like [Diadema setosum]|uniref:receptor-type tyrosine-protein phosphatase S-like n=1 Tax=Diadema setosum TaxID=31175 RepID=UPI003B3BD8B1